MEWHLTKERIEVQNRKQEVIGVYAELHRQQAEQDHLTAALGLLEEQLEECMATMDQMSSELQRAQGEKDLAMHTVGVLKLELELSKATQLGGPGWQTAHLKDPRGEAERIAEAYSEPRSAATLLQASTSMGLKGLCGAAHLPAVKAELRVLAGPPIDPPTNKAWS